MYTLEKLSNSNNSQTSRNSNRKTNKAPADPLLLGFVEELPKKAEISAMSDDSTYTGQTQSTGAADYSSD